MKKFIFGIFLMLSVIIGSVFVKIITIEAGNNDCMLEYVVSDSKAGYVYKLDNFMYHIDSEQYKNLDIIGISRGCAIIPYEKKFAFMALSNTLYCSIVSSLI